MLPVVEKLILQLSMVGEEGAVFLLAGRSSTTVVVLLKTTLLLLGREDCY
jgi:hypothetical protein